MEGFTKAEKERIKKKVEELKIRKRVLTTWDIIKEKDFHLNSDYLVIEKGEFFDVLEACIEVLDEGRLK